MKLFDEEEFRFVLGVALVCVGAALLTAAMVEPGVVISKVFVAGGMKGVGAMMIYRVIRS